MKKNNSNSEIELISEYITDVLAKSLLEPSKVFILQEEDTISFLSNGKPIGVITNCFRFNERMVRKTLNMLIYVMDSLEKRNQNNCLMAFFSPYKDLKSTYKGFKKLDSKKK